MSFSLPTWLRRKPSQPVSQPSPPPGPLDPSKGPGGAPTQPFQPSGGLTEAEIARQRRLRAKQEDRSKVQAPSGPPEIPPNVLRLREAIMQRQQFIQNSDAMARHLASRLIEVIQAEPYPATTIVFVLEMLKHSAVVKARQDTENSTANTQGPRSNPNGSPL